MKLERMPKIGIIGGGQLGKMLIQKAMQWSVPIDILDAEDCVASTYAHHHIIGSLKDADAIEQLSKNVDVLTYEIEHINSDKLIELQQQGKTVIPNPLILKMIQDKGTQKQFYQQHQIPTASFVLVDNKAELLEQLQTMTVDQVVIKSRTGGYDGKGVYINSRQNILNNPSIVPFDEPMVVEMHIPFKKELAILAAQDLKGNIVTYPCIEMEFDAQSNLVSYLFSPADIPLHIEENAKELAIQCLKAFNSPGLFAIETFLTYEDQLIVNEVAPRPHNSAHHTIEGFYTSQYEQLLRVLCQLPLGDANLKSPCAMLNIVAGPNQSGPYKLKYFKELSAIKGVYIHLYGKATAKPNRKLGHITICLPTKEEVFKVAHQLKNLLEIELI